MSRLASILTLLIFPVLIIGLVQELRHYPLIAASMAAGPMAVTLLGGALALFHNSKLRIHNSEGVYQHGNPKKEQSGETPNGENRSAPESR
jgi:uncharacterized membrane protein